MNRSVVIQKLETKAKRKIVISDIHEVVTKHDNEWFISDKCFGLKNSISKTTWVALADKVEVDSSGIINQFQQVCLTFLFQVVF